MGVERPKTHGNRKILGVRVKVDRQKLRSNDAEKSRREKNMSLRERKSLFGGGEGRDSINNLLSNSRGGGKQEVSSIYLSYLMQVLKAGTWVPQCWLKEMNSYLKFSEPSSGGIYLSLLPKTRSCIPNLHNYFGYLHSRYECLLGLCFCKYRVYSDDTEPEISSHSSPSAAILPATCGWVA